MKKFIALFLVFSLVMLSVNLYAKERRGAKLIITRKNGYPTEGELIAVKPNSLLLLSATGRDVSVDIANIKVIRVVKKSKAGLGLLMGIAIGVLSALIFPWYIGIEDSPNVGLIVNPIGGALIGAGIGAVAGIDKTINIEGMTDSEIQETLDKLRKYARIRNYK
jgi:hypothetical protein